MVAHIVSVRLTGLCHQVRDIHDGRLRLPDLLHDILHDEVRENTGIKASRTEDDQIRVRDLLPHAVSDMDVVIVGKAGDPPDVPAHVFLAVELRIAHLVFSHQFHPLLAERQHLAFDLQKPAHVSCRLCQVSLEVDQRREKNVPDRMIVQGAAGPVEPVAQQLDEIIIHVRHGEKNLAHVAHRGNIKLLLQHPCAAAVVAHRDDRRHFHRKQLQAGKQAGKPGPSAEYDDLLHF